MRSSRPTSKGKCGVGTHHSSDRFAAASPVDIPPPKGASSRGGTVSVAHKKTKIIFPVACRLLKDLGEEGFAQICECMHAKELKLRNKETFIVESDPCDRIGIVVTGAVRLSRQRLDDGRNVLETIQPNDTFGTTYVFRDVKSMGISLSAVGDTRVILFEVDRIMKPCHKVCFAHVQFVRNLLAVMSQKTLALKQKLRILSQRTIRGRLMLFLQIRAKRAKSNEFEIPFDRQALADFLCVDRSALSAEISKLRKERLVESVKNRFKLLT